MKNNLMKRISMVVGLAVVIMAIAFNSLTAQTKGGGGRLEGTWDAQVSITNCQTGDVIVSFPSIASFMQGGTSIGSTAGIPQSLRTPEHGVWRHVEGNTYEFRFKTFSFNAQNAPSGWSIVSHIITLDSSADTYTSSGTVEFFNPIGVQVGGGCSTAVGTRFTFPN